MNSVHLESLYGIELKALRFNNDVSISDIQEDLGIPESVLLDIEAGHFKEHLEEVKELFYYFEIESKWSVFEEKYGSF